MLVCNTLKGKNEIVVNHSCVPKVLKKNCLYVRCKLVCLFFGATVNFKNISARHNSEIRRKNVEKARKNNIGVIKNSSFGMAWHDLVM